MSTENPYQYSGTKRTRSEVPPGDRLATPVAFPAAKPKPRMLLLPVIKARPTNPPRVATVAQDKASSAAADVVPVPVVRPPTVQNLDDYLGLVGNMYYQQAETGRASSQWALIRRTTLGVLTSPVREPSVLDKWSPHEIALFESAICLVGKMFSQIAHVVKTKTGEECVEFYYVWKMSTHYAQWKATYKQTYGDIEDQL